MAQENQYKRGVALGRTYASAILSLVSEPSAMTAALEELGGIESLLEREPQFLELLRGPLLPVERKLELIERTLRGRVSDVVCNAVLVIARNGRIGLLPVIIQAFRSLVHQQQGRQEVEVITAVPLTDQTREEVQAVLARRLGRQPVLTARVDPAILGGMIVRVDDKVTDDSVRTQLSQFDRALRRVAAG